jgi:hypothetical protein
LIKKKKISSYATVIVNFARGAFNSGVAAFGLVVVDMGLVASYSAMCVGVKLHWRSFAFGVHVSDDSCMTCGVFLSGKPALLHFDMLRLVPALILFFTCILCFLDVHY